MPSNREQEEVDGPPMPTAADAISEKEIESVEVMEHSESALAARRAYVARLYSRGKSLRQIGKIVGLAPGHLSREIRIIQQNWIKTAGSDLIKRMLIEAERWNELERTYWHAWEQSCKAGARKRAIEMESAEIEVRRKRLKELLEVEELERMVASKLRGRGRPANDTEFEIQSNSLERIYNEMVKRSGLDKVDRNVDPRDAEIDAKLEKLASGLPDESPLTGTTADSSVSDEWSAEFDLSAGDPRFLAGAERCVIERAKLFKLYNIDPFTGALGSEDNKAMTKAQGASLSKKIDDLVKGFLPAAAAAVVAINNAVSKPNTTVVIEHEPEKPKQLPPPQSKPVDPPQIPVVSTTLMNEMANDVRKASMEAETHTKPFSLGEAIAARMPAELVAEVKGLDLEVPKSDESE